MRLDRVERAQLAYWAVGAFWPLIAMKSFERVTGNKRDEWLVRTVALMMLSTLATLETLRAEAGQERALRVLGATSTAALGSVALIGPLVGRISKVYLVDAAVDLVLAVLWIVTPSERVDLRRQPDGALSEIEPGIAPRETTFERP